MITLFSPIGLFDIVFIISFFILTIVFLGRFLYCEINSIIIKRMRVNAKFFRDHLGTDDFRNSRTHTCWKLSRELADIQSRVSIITFLSIKRNIVEKTLKVFKRIELRDKLYSRMTVEQQKQVDKTLLEAKLAIAREVVDLAALHMRVTDSQMKFITGTDSSYIWFSQENKEACEQSLRVLNPAPENALALSNGPDSVGNGYS